MSACEAERLCLPPVCAFRGQRCIYSHTRNSYLSGSAGKKKKPLLPLGKSMLPLKLATHLLSALREGRAAAWLVMVKITAWSCQEDVPSAVVPADLGTGDRGVHTGTREMLPWDFMLRLRKFCNVQNDMGMIL